MNTEQVQYLSIFLRAFIRTVSPRLSDKELFERERYSIVL